MTFNTTKHLILGYDPGGVGANGVAILEDPVSVNPSVSVYTCDSVDEALCWVHSRVGVKKVEAAGIDSLLSWSTQKSGWRPMDTYLRERYPGVSGSVVAGNSASGSMVIQGMAMAMRLRDVWPSIVLNETHPKVQYFALSRRKYAFGENMVNWLFGLLGEPEHPEVTNDHEWDALFSAWATWMGLCGKWSINLMDIFEDPLIPVENVNYYWP